MRYGGDGAARHRSLRPSARRAGKELSQPATAPIPVFPHRRHRGLDRSAAMAGHGGHGDRRLADRLAATRPALRRLLLFPAEQPALGDLGLARRGLGADRPAGLPGGDEHSRCEEERRPRTARARHAPRLNCESGIAVYTPNRRRT